MAKVTAHIVNKDRAGRDVIWVSTDKLPSEIPEEARELCQRNYRTQQAAQDAAKKVEEISNSQRSMKCSNGY